VKEINRRVRLVVNRIGKVGLCNTASSCGKTNAISCIFNTSKINYTYFFFALPQASQLERTFNPGPIATTGATAGGSSFPCIPSMRNPMGLQFDGKLTSTRKSKKIELIEVISRFCTGVSDEIFSFQ